jgi:flagellar hook-length control protein FliK
MNATPPVSQAQFGNDASQLNPAASDSAVLGSNSQDFAKALSDAGGKSGRKALSHSTGGRDPSGSHLPAAGNSSPSPLPPPPAATTPTAGSAAGTPHAAPAAALSAAASPAAGTPAAANPQSGNGPISTTSPLGWTGAATQPAMAGIPAGEAEPSGTPPTAPLAAGGASTPQTMVDAQTPAAVTDLSQGINHSLESTSNELQPANSATSAATAAAGSPKGHDSPSSADSSLAASAPLMISSAAVSAAARPAARAFNGDSASLKTVQAPAPQERTASQPGASAANGATNAPDTGAHAEALAATLVHVGAAATSEAPAADLASPAAANLAVQDMSVRQQDAAMANAAQANAAQASVAREPATAPATPSGQVAAAAAAASNAQALLARASVAADKPAAGSDAMASLSLDSSAAAGAAQLLANAPVLSPAPPVLNVAPRVDSTEFGQGVAGQVSFMMDRNLNSASLQVNPASLGPIEVRIALQGGHAQVWLTSHSAVTRDALESSSSKLREMLGTQGFGQVSVDVSQRSFQERSSQSQTYSALPPMERSATALSAAAQSRSAGSIARAASGLVDAYA